MAADQGLCRPRGGATKIHLVCDGHGHPHHAHLTAGQAHEATALKPLFEGVDAKVTDFEGKPIAWPIALAGNKGYRSNWINECNVSSEVAQK